MKKKVLIYYQTLKKYIATLNDQRQSLKKSYIEFHWGLNNLENLFQNNFGIVQSYLFMIEGRSQAKIYQSKLLDYFGQKNESNNETDPQILTMIQEEKGQDEGENAEENISKKSKNIKIYS